MSERGKVFRTRKERLGKELEMLQTTVYEVNKSQSGKHIVIFEPIHKILRYQAYGKISLDFIEVNGEDKVRYLKLDADIAVFDDLTCQVGIHVKTVTEDVLVRNRDTVMKILRELHDMFIGVTDDVNLNPEVITLSDTDEEMLRESGLAKSDVTRGTISKLYRTDRGNEGLEKSTQFGKS